MQLDTFHEVFISEKVLDQVCCLSIINIKLRAILIENLSELAHIMWICQSFLLKRLLHNHFHKEEFLSFLRVAHVRSLFVWDILPDHFTINHYIFLSLNIRSKVEKLEHASDSFHISDKLLLLSQVGVVRLSC